MNLTQSINPQPIILINRPYCKDKEINTISALALSGALYNWMLNGHKGSPEEVAALPIAKEANKIAVALRESQFYSASPEQTVKVKKVLDEISTCWQKGGEPFQTYINFTIAILEDILKFEKNSKFVTAKLNELLDLMSAMLPQFDPDYEDLEAAETAGKAFKIWKRNKFF